MALWRKIQGQPFGLAGGDGDSPANVLFYERCGFARSHIRKNFFTDHYDHPVYDGGVRLIDMVYLRKSIKGENGMFRKMRRYKQQVPDAACCALLAQEKRAALSVNGEEGYPYTVPIDFYYDEAENTIYFHGAREGHKAEAMQRCDKVCLTAWDQGYKKEGHWEWNATSVVVFGRAKFIDDASVKREKLQKLAEKYYPTRQEIEEEMNGPGFARAQLFAIEIEQMTGKLVREK